MAFSPLGNSDHVVILIKFPLTFHQTQNGMPYFIAKLMTVCYCDRLMTDCMSKWLSVWLQTKWLWVRVMLQSLAYDYSRTDCVSLCDHLRDVPWGDILKLSASVANDFCEWVQVGINVYIPHHKYLVKPHLSPWFLAACTAAIIHRNHFFWLY